MTEEMEEEDGRLYSKATTAPSLLTLRELKFSNLIYYRLAGEQTWEDEQVV